jgi:hypothetical protein
VVGLSAAGYVLQVVTDPLSALEAGLRKAVEFSGWTVQAQTGILADKRDLDWKHRVGVRGRACAILAAA